jgi:hypothetical protein
MSSLEEGKRQMTEDGSWEVWKLRSLEVKKLRR